MGSKINFRPFSDRQPDVQDGGGVSGTVQDAITGATYAYDANGMRTADANGA